ncbi:probable NADH dehydrogenase [ubiquinone] 1 alpha subcomplex assembly factor at N-terminal half [Coccomyxa sp. Obi]|nr:probable NADH dehydrogenase [ubiquinone] 1 alpha subcomplex assembly factor at N-terminal half [Coccomyxa sp. Obi]
MGSLFRRLGARLSRLISSKELIGQDVHGNKYYRWPDTNLHGEPVEKRIIKTPDGRYDPNLVPPEWAQWLKQTRGPPPSPEEIQQMEAKRQAIRHRAAALEAAEAQRRFQEATLGRQAEQAGGPNQDRFLQQLTGRGYPAGQQAGNPRPQPSSKQSRTPETEGGQRDQGAAKPADDGKGQFEADVWKPGG